MPYLLGKLNLNLLQVVLIICVGFLKFPEQLLVGQTTVVQIGHDGSPALVLEVFVVHQSFTKRAKFVGNFKHFLENAES